ncbi:tryptophan 7-halogenase [Steroidobacter cummioxidans]|uniref:tryptophan 7-halogenase n=1 Tax=Steroidobacter cummioxidans TaxID=1803913 RepID=UPI000E319ED3|nr:tryptophan 7-halogenase [Steroidobacter cummioxidans]
MSALTKVVIVGRDIDLWLSACVLQTALYRSGVSVTAIELPTQLHAADVYVTLPALEALHKRLRIEEPELLAATRGVFSLGQNFVGADGRQTYFHAYGAYGSAIDYKAFFPHWLRARSLGANASLEDFSLTATAAKHGRMLVPDRATENYGRTDYAYHLPAVEYVRFVKGRAQRLGVTVHQAQTAGCTIDPLTGDVAAMSLDQDRRIGGQLFIDASGPEALLIGSSLGVPRESWRDSSPIDRVIVASGDAFASIPAHAEIRAHANGWVGLYPSRSCTHVIEAYSSTRCSASEAMAAAAAVSRLALQNAAIRICDPGIRTRAWERNVVAVGGAACTFDPVHSVQVQALQMGLVHLLSLFPAGEQVSGAERAEFNRVSRLSFERLRDFQVAHYLLNRCEVHASAELLHKIVTFRARGEVPLYEHETFSLDSWLAQFIGNGQLPESYDPAADGTAPDLLKAELKRMLRFIKDKVLEQTTHDAYLQRWWP